MVHYVYQSWRFDVKYEFYRIYDNYLEIQMKFAVID